MSAIPTPYTPVTSFNSDMAGNAGVVPTSEGVKWDAEFAALQVWTAAQQARMNLVTRSDGSLGTKVVTLDQLGSDVLASMGGSGLNGRGTWVTLTTYAKGDIVINSSISYLCVTNHAASALFATDLASVYWIAVSSQLTTGSISSSTMFASQVVINAALGLLSVATGNLQLLSVTAATIADSTITWAKTVPGAIVTTAGIVADQTNTTNVQSDVTGLSLLLAAATTYFVQLAIPMQTSAGGMNLRINCTGVVSSALYWHNINAAGAILSAVSPTSIGSEFPSISPGVTNSILYINGYVTTAAAATLQVQFRSTTNTQTTIIKQGSFVRC